MNIDYSTVFSLAPFINENIVTIIGICLLIGAMAKSSQVGLHIWLPMAMEGLKKSKVFFNISYNDIKSLEEILKWLESLLSRGDIPYSLFLSLLIAFLAILINILIGQNGNIPERKMDLVPVTVLINGRRCVGIIDL